MMSKVRAGFLIMLVTILTIVSSASALSAQNTAAVDVYYVPMSFTFDGGQYQPPMGQQGFIYKGSSYVPLRFVSYSLERAVKWDAKTNTVSVYNPSKAEQIAIQDYKLNTQVHNSSKTSQGPGKPQATKLQVNKQKITYLFDGTQKQPSTEQPGLVIKDTLYVPLRFISESVGKQIDWNSATYGVSVAFKAASASGVQTGPKVNPSKDQPAVNNGESPTGSPGAGGVTVGDSDTNKPTYEALTSAAESKLNELKDRSTRELTAVVNRYMDSQDSALILEGLNDLAGFDAEFEGIVGKLEKDLRANGYSTDIIKTYRETYEKIKAEQQEKVRDKIASS